MQLINYKLLLDSCFDLKWESALAELLSVISSNQLEVIYCGPTELEAAEHLWLCLGDASENCFGISLAGWSRQSQISNYFKNVLNCAQNLQHVSSSLKVLPQYQLDTSVQIFKLQIKSKAACNDWNQSAYLCLGKIGALQNTLSAIGRFGKGQTSPALVKLRLRAQFTNSADDAKKLSRLYFTAKIAQEQNLYLVKVNPDKCDLELEILEELSMDDIANMDLDQAQQPICMDVCLGTLKLKLSEFLALRPGSKVSFARPEPFQAIIKLGEQEFALANVEFSEDRVNLSVSELRC